MDAIIKNQINKFLNSQYVISTTEESSKKVMLIVNYGIYYKSDETLKELKHCQDLVSEIVEIFGIDKYAAKYIINEWANVDLKWYWCQSDIKFQSYSPILIYYK